MSESNEDTSRSGSPIARAKRRITPLSTNRKRPQIFAWVKQLVLKEAMGGKAIFQDLADFSYFCFLFFHPYCKGPPSLPYLSDTERRNKQV
jgi:hypothetical protein